MVLESSVRPVRKWSRIATRGPISKEAALANAVGISRRRLELGRGALGVTPAPAMGDGGRRRSPNR